MQIILTPEESEECFINALCNSLSYMEGYGLELSYNKEHYKEAADKLESPCLEDVLLQILKDGHEITFIDHELDGEYTRSIKLEDVHNRVQNTPISHLIDMLFEDDDADTGDMILQTVFYGEIIFS